MRLMRFASDAVSRDVERRESAAPVATAIGHVGVDAEIVPARREGRPLADGGRRQQRAHVFRLDAGEAAATHLRCDRLEHRAQSVAQSRMTLPERPEPIVSKPCRKSCTAKWCVMIGASPSPLCSRLAILYHVSNISRP